MRILKYIARKKEQVGQSNCVFLTNSQLQYMVIATLYTIERKV